MVHFLNLFLLNTSKEIIIIVVVVVIIAAIQMYHKYIHDFILTKFCYIYCNVPVKQQVKNSSQLNSPPNFIGNENLQHFLSLINCLASPGFLQL